MSNPFGTCECRSRCQCSEEPGPAAYSIVRQGVSLRVCTRCTLLGDEKKTPLPSSNDDCVLFFEYDPLGATVLADYIREKEATQ